MGKNSRNRIQRESSRTGRSGSGRERLSREERRELDRKKARARKRRNIRLAFMLFIFILGIVLGFLLGRKVYNKASSTTADTSKNTAPGISTGKITDGAINAEKENGTGPGSDSGNDENISASASKVICLDAGHGFDDAGTFSDYIPCYEKDINLEIVKLLKKELEARGCKVILTHDGSSFPDCDEIKKEADSAGLDYQSSQFRSDNIFNAYERTIYANILNKQYDFDLFISVHVNSFEQESVSGFRIDYCAENDQSSFSASFAEKMKAAINNAFPDTKLKLSADSFDKSFIVNKYCKMPSLLLEIGYCTNKTDAANMMNAEWRNKLVKTIAGAV